jgi:predicted dehydrogenase
MLYDNEPQLAVVIPKAFLVPTVIAALDVGCHVITERPGCNAPTTWRC